MRLRLALKIMKAVGTPRQAAYSEWQVGAADARYNRTRTARETQAAWDGCMRFLGPGGRAELMARWGHPDKALDLLVRTPEEKWKGDPAAWPFGRAEG